MSAGNGKGPKKQKASEGDDPKPHEITFRGIDFTLDPQLPVTAAFDLAGIGGPFADLRFLASVLGDDQMTMLRAKCDADGLKLDPDGTKVLGNLVEEILSAYGFETGESLASAKS